MEFNSQELTIAWAVQVSLPQLGAGLVAYLETKTSLLVLRILIRKSSCKTMKQMPEELILKVADYLGAITFDNALEEWIKVADCLRWRCLPLTHFTQERLNERARDYPPNVSEEELDNIFMPDYHDRHYEIVNDFCRDLKVRQYPKFAKCAEVFYKQFGIRPYILLDVSYNNQQSRLIDWVDDEAYLIYPIAQLPIESCADSGIASLLINDAIDLSTLRKLTDQDMEKFRTAAKVLKLRHYEADKDEEDESAFLDDPRSPYEKTISFIKKKSGIKDADRTTDSKQSSGPSEAAVKATGQMSAAKDEMETPLVPQLRVFASRGLDAWNAVET